MRSLSLVIVVASFLFFACGGGQPTPAAPEQAAPPAPAPEAVDAGPAAEPAPAPAPAEPEKPALKTPENLQAAYAGETDAATRYKAFAEAADKDKYKDVAAMFRAVTRAEELHAQKLADLITAAGGKPVAGTAKPEVKKTEENVKAALAGETAEATTMYPGFVETAKAEGNVAAESAFKGIAEVEAALAKLFKKADKDLAYWKKAEREFYLCPVCGLVTTSKKESCAVCGTDPSAFEQIE